MDNKLVIDLGGVHGPLEKTFSVDELNLTEGISVGPSHEMKGF